MTQQSIKYWVVAADGGTARNYLYMKYPQEFSLVQRLESSTRQQPSREIMSDASGRNYHAKGPASHAKQSRRDAHEQSEDLFVREVIERLEHGARRKDFDQLVLIADPRTLGKLRKTLGSSLKRAVYKDSNLDLTPLSELQLRARVSDLLA